MINDELSYVAKASEAYLSKTVTVTDSALAPLFDSMRYSLFAGGKRIRPYLVFAFAKLFGGQEEVALPFAAALEMIHTYSLIHDDLPAMDNDDYRRGRLTNHKVYGEAEAILAGDGLQTMAFEVLMQAKCDADTLRRATVCLSHAAGPYGMVGGQAMDIASEKAKPTVSQLDTIHRLKTGALMVAGAELGTLASCNYDDARLLAARTYAEGIGRAFQIIDDLLDVYGNFSVLGKEVGQDEKTGKTTYLSFMTPEEARTLAKKETEKAKKAIQFYPGNESLLSLADTLLIREK